MNIRNLEIDGEKWFVAKDICHNLDIKDSNTALRSIPDIFKKKALVQTPGGKQTMIMMNENGIVYFVQKCRSIHKDKLIDFLDLKMEIIYDCKESSYLKILSSAFKSFSQKFQFQVGKYRIDWYFVDYKLAIEVDEHNHNNRDEKYELERQKFIEQQLGCEFIRFNPDEKYFNIGDVIYIILEKTLLKNKFEQ